MTYTEARPGRWTLSEVRAAGTEWPSAGDIPAVHRTYWDLLSGAQLPRAGRASWTRGALDRLDRLAKLGPAWDGEQAKSISPGVVDAVQGFVTSDLIEHLPTKPELVPTLEGGIQLEWHTSSIDLIIECEASGSVTYYYRDVEADEEFEGSLLEAGNPLTSAFVKLGYQA